jgi:hypothetical protein
MLSHLAGALAAAALFAAAPAALAQGSGEDITEFVNEDPAPEETYDSAACERLETLGIEINETWTYAREDYFAGVIDRSDLEWRLGNLKNHLENYERDAGFAGCDQLAADMRWVLGEMTMP